MPKETHRGNGTTTMPPLPLSPESKRQRFERVAVPRVQKVIKAIDTLSKIGSNASSYEFEQADVDKICDRISAELNRLRERMTPPGKKRQIDFSF